MNFYPVVFYLGRGGICPPLARYYPFAGVIEAFAVFIVDLWCPAYRASPGTYYCCCCPAFTPSWPIALYDLLTCSWFLLAFYRGSILSIAIKFFEYLGVYDII